MFHEGHRWCVGWIANLFVNDIFRQLTGRWRPLTYSVISLISGIRFAHIFGQFFPNKFIFRYVCLRTKNHSPPHLQRNLKRCSFGEKPSTWAKQANAQAKRPKAGTVNAISFISKWQVEIETNVKSCSFWSESFLSTLKLFTHFFSHLHEVGWTSDKLSQFKFSFSRTYLTKIYNKFFCYVCYFD